ncbi:hypothetical protein BUALT_Bualt15G0089200 [Buddleja alternifolia]|uniref:Bromo domain-containing protein n=1 Tax=Buddleja alternifolia TaxID=168488 RepID=A0AAV6WC23_9LAMI|nr:hypothetical protein BUALT_Bualt15G0089200 [Buddleja alternifolia]
MERAFDIRGIRRLRHIILLGDNFKEEMKRKRGSGKRKARKPFVTEAADVSVDPGYYSDINAENDGFDSRKEIETREVNTNLSGQRVGLDKPVTNNKTVGGAAATLAWAISSSCTNLKSDRVQLQHERVGEKEPKSSLVHHVYNKPDLDAAQSVIKKIMETDAAVPFNAPVDPIAMGIPDYFDIIDTPMDFGTICSKLENGLKYRNSEEVLNDVQLIWDNCCKYNKKGSYIVELMKRVKNNFMKQWAAAGLYKEQRSVNNGHLSHNSQVLAEPTMRHEETEHLNPVSSTISRSAYLQEHDWSQRQHQQLSNCCSHSFKPQQISCCSHTQHDLAPQHDHFAHLQPVNLMNGKPCSQWVNEAGPSLVQSSRPSPSCSFMGPPKQRPFMHHSSSSQLPQLPQSHLQSGLNAQSAGHLHLPLREHAFNSGRDDDNRYHPQQYQVDPVHMQAYQPSASCMPVHQPNQCASHQFQSSHIDGGRNINFAGNMHIPPPTESTANCNKRGTEYPQAPVTDKTSCQNLNQMNSTPEKSSSSMANIEPCQPLEKTCQNQPESSPSEHLHSTADNNFSKRKTRSQGRVQCQEQLSSMMNGQEQIETVSPQSRPPPCTAVTMQTRAKSKRLISDRGRVDSSRTSLLMGDGNQSASDSGSDDADDEQVPDEASEEVHAQHDGLPHTSEQREPTNSEIEDKVERDKDGREILIIEGKREYFDKGSFTNFNEDKNEAGFKISGASSQLKSHIADSHLALSFISTAAPRSMLGDLRSWYNDVWPTFNKVPEHVKEKLFERFKTKFTWRDPWSEWTVYKIFKSYCSRSFSSEMLRLRTEKKSRSAPPPDYMRQDIWEALWDIWETPKFKKLGEKCRRNRLSDRDGLGVAKSTAGTISIAHHARRMALKNDGRPVPHEMVFGRCHRRNKGQGPFVDQKSKQTLETYNKLKETQSQSNGSMISTRGSSTFYPKAWAEASGGLKNGRSYGVGNLYNNNVTPSGPNPSNSSSQVEVEQLKEQLQELKREQQELKAVLGQIISATHTTHGNVSGQHFSPGQYPVPGQYSAPPPSQYPPPPPPQY